MQTSHVLFKATHLSRCYSHIHPNYLLIQAINRIFLPKSNINHIKMKLNYYLIKANSFLKYHFN